MQLSIITQKLSTLYGAFAPDFGVVSYGSCRDEAVNNLQDAVALSRQAGAAAVAVASPDRPFRCANCRRAFRSYSNLQTHSREHQSPRQCRNCGRQLRDNEYHRC